MSYIRLNASPHRRIFPASMAGGLSLFLLGLFIAACEVEPLPPDPTITPTIYLLPASPTVNPAPVTPASSEGDGGGDSGDVALLGTHVLEFTPAAPEVIGGATITPPPAATEQSIPMNFVMDDGVSLAGRFYGAPVRPAPALLLVHGAGEDRRVWMEVVPLLQQGGLNVLIIDLRGAGDSGGRLAWDAVPSDLRAIFSRLLTLPGVRGAAMGGVGMGGTAAILACAEVDGCRGAFAVSPQTGVFDPTLNEALTIYGVRPLLLAYGSEDAESAAVVSRMAAAERGAIRQLTYSGAGQGVALITTESALQEALIAWVRGG